MKKLKTYLQKGQTYLADAIDCGICLAIDVCYALYLFPGWFKGEVKILFKEVYDAQAEVAKEFNLYLLRGCEDWQSLTPEELERRGDRNDAFYARVLSEIEQEKADGKWVPTPVEQGEPDLRDPIYEPPRLAVYGFLAMFCSPALIAGLCSYL